MGSEPLAILQSEGPLQIFGDDLNKLLAGHLVNLAHLAAPFCIGVEYESGGRMHSLHRCSPVTRRVPDRT